MTLPASGQISIQDICTEFGLPGNSVFPTAFYGKGGAPSSGALSLADFYGRAGTPPFSASASPTSIYNLGSTVTITSDFASAFASGGTGPYTYVWSFVSANTGFTILTPNNQNTQFRCAGMGIGDARTATFRCTVTDSLGAVVNTNNIDVTIERGGTSGTA